MITIYESIALTIGAMILCIGAVIGLALLARPKSDEYPY